MTNLRLDVFKTVCFTKNNLQPILLFLSCFEMLHPTRFAAEHSSSWTDPFARITQGPIELHRMSNLKGGQLPKQT